MPLPRVLVLGDNIQDIYRHFTATRLCPEGPVPVLVNPKNEVIATDGGAGLVDRQLAELLGRENVTYISGSLSEKERIFADGRLMLRIDRDSIWTQFTSVYEDQISSALSNHRSYDAVVISDYGKGAIGELVAKFVLDRTLNHIPVFVDAKITGARYWGAFAVFPNAKEVKNIVSHGFRHVIQKDGENGCFVDGFAIPTTPHAVKDVTGAGDVFLAAFVYHFLIGNQVEFADKKFSLMYFTPETEQRARLQLAAKFANKVAGKSVEFIGTHVVTKDEITY